MADQYSSRYDNKRKFDDDSPPPPTRRPTGFSAPIVSATPEGAADEFELVKQRAQEIAAKIFGDSEAKRTKIETNPGIDSSNDYTQKSYAQQLPSFTTPTPAASYNPYGGGGGYMGASKKIDIPNGRVGVIIGKGGETIKYLQQQSGGCKIQVTRDADADPYSQTRTVELTGTPEQMDKAEKLISDVLAEAESGGSNTVTARGYGGGLGGGEQFSMQVPSNKVGLIIGKGGETIKNMQASTGAKIQIIPLHPPPGDTSLERTVQINGTPDQIESAKQLVNEAISQTRGRNSQFNGGYSQQGYRPPQPQTNWGAPGSQPTQQTGYGYMQPGAYAGQPAYGGYPTQPASGGYASGYDQSSNTSTQQTTPGTGYDYYNQQPTQQQTLNTASAPADSYNYGQPPAYNSQGSYADASYNQTATGGQQQAYGQDSYSGGYNTQPPQPGVPQPGSNSQAQGYAGQPPSSASTYGSSAQQGYTGQPASSVPASYPSSQPTYGQSPQAGQKQAVQTGYGQTQSPQSAQAVYQQSGGAQGGYVQPYGQQVSYAGYGQQQQYSDAYGSGGYAQPPAGPAAPVVPGGVTKASPKS